MLRLRMLKGIMLEPGGNITPAPLRFGPEWGGSHPGEDRRPEDGGRMTGKNHLASGMFF